MTDASKLMEDKLAAFLADLDHHAESAGINLPKLGLDAEVSVGVDLFRALVAVAKAAARCVDLSQPETQAMRHDLEEAGKAANVAIGELRRIADARGAR